MKKLTIFTFCLCLVCLFSVSAESLKKDKKPGKLSKWQTAVEYSYVKYSEPGVMQEKGNMIGASAHYIEEYDNNYQARIELKYSTGEIDYTSDMSGTMDDVNDDMFEFRGIVAYKTPFFTDRVAVIPYGGFAYRYLSDDLGGRISSYGHYGYLRESRYYYAPIGVEFKLSGKKSSLCLFAEYDWFWFGAQKSYLSDIDANYNDLDNNQKKGYGLRGAVKLMVKGKKVTLFIESFIKYWNIKQSEYDYITYGGAIVGVGYEPKNNSREMGGRIGLEF